MHISFISTSCIVASDLHPVCLLQMHTLCNGFRCTLCIFTFGCTFCVLPSDRHLYISIISAVCILDSDQQSLYTFSHSVATFTVCVWLKSHEVNREYFNLCCCSCRLEVLDERNKECMEYFDGETPWNTATEGLTRRQEIIIVKIIICLVNDIF